MVPRILLDSAELPGGGTLRLVQRGGEYSIMLGAEELMNSRRAGSEAALASLACAALGRRRAPRLLIGGLGLGFTLREALERLPADAEIVVAELVPAVVAWAHGPLAPVHGASLDDDRVHIVEEDVARALACGTWDAILLDVDNGPDGLTMASNDRLYRAEDLAAARRALRPGGILAVWSARPDAAFAARLRASGFSVKEHEARSGKGRGARHVVWIAVRD
jgi:spermidine synthase